MRNQLKLTCAQVALASALALCPAVVAAQPAPAPAASAAETPRLANGKPDLSGYWTRGRGGFFGGPGGAAPESTGDAFAIIPARDGRLTNLENDSFIEQKSEENIPIYKPEHWAKVRELDYNGNREDPTFHCKPAGVPRMGPPNRIIAFPNEVILFNNTVFRIIKLGTKRNPDDLETWNGSAEARWDGDTLVVESAGFNEESWLGWGGYFHSFDLKVTERFTRKGNELAYDVVVEDPVLLEPWRPDPVKLRLNTDPNVTIAEATPCDERDAEHIQDNIRG